MHSWSGHLTFAITSSEMRCSLVSPNVKYIMLYHSMCALRHYEWTFCVVFFYTGVTGRCFTCFSNLIPYIIYSVLGVSLSFHGQFIASATEACHRRHHHRHRNLLQHCSPRGGQHTKWMTNLPCRGVSGWAAVAKIAGIASRFVRDDPSEPPTEQDRVSS